MAPYTGDRLAWETGDAMAARVMKAAAEPMIFHVGFEVVVSFNFASMISGPLDFGAIVSLSGV